MKEIGTLIYEEFLCDHFNTTLIVTLSRIYYRLFEKIPHTYDIKYNVLTQKPYIVKDYGSDVINQEIINKEQTIGIDVRGFFKNVEESKKFKKFPYILNAFSGGSLYIGDHIVFNCSYHFGYSDKTSLDILTFLTEDDKYLQPILELLPDFYKEINTSYNYVSIDGQGNFGYSVFKIDKNANVSLSNYNEDVPYNEYLSFCNSDGCGLSLMYGKPGTGKTTLIKKLISNSKTKFFLLDASLLGNITSANFVDFLLEECENSVFILEDCEKLLLDRNTQYNPWIGTILNLTDGMLGEGLNIKFICTFNAPINSIDPALLRKGRLKVSYEFKPLDSKRVENLGKEIHKDIHGSQTLADIYGTDYTNSSSLNKTNKIGF